MAETVRKNDFTQGSMMSNIIKMATPLTMALLVNVLYSVVDRVYIGHIPDVGADALTGIGIASPVILLISAFQALCSTGGAPLCSIARGKGDLDTAELYLGNSYTLLVSMGVILAILGELFAEPLLRLVGASDTILGYSMDYLRIYLVGTVFVLTGTGMNPFINSQGFAKTGMLTVMLGAAVNIALDPLFIFVFDMGVKGAALATVIAQFCAALWVFLFLTGKKAILKLRLCRMKLVPEIVKRSLALGVTGFVMSFTNGLVSMVYNSSLTTLGGEVYVTAMTIISSTREIIFMPISGISGGAQPVLGYNFGAARYDRVREGIKAITTLLFSFSIPVWLLLMWSPETFIHLFNSDPELIEVGAHAMRLYFGVYFVQTFQMCGQCVFQGLGMTRYAIFFSILRKVVIVVPMALILPHIFGLGVDGVFLSEPVSEALGSVSCFCTMMAVVLPKMKRLEAEKAAAEK